MPFLYSTPGAIFLLVSAVALFTIGVRECSRRAVRTLLTVSAVTFTVGVLLCRAGGARAQEFRLRVDSELRSHYAATATRIGDLPWRLDDVSSTQLVVTRDGAQRLANCTVAVRTSLDDLLVTCGGYERALPRH